MTGSSPLVALSYALSNHSLTHDQRTGTGHSILTSLARWILLTARIDPIHTEGAVSTGARSERGTACFVFQIIQVLRKICATQEYAIATNSRAMMMDRLEKRMDSTSNIIANSGLDRLLHEILAAALSNHQWRMLSFEEAVSEKQVEIALAPGSGAADDVVASIRYIRERLPSCKIVLLGVDGSDADIIRFIQEGACAYVSAQQGLADLVQTLRMVQDNRSSCSGPVTQLVIDAIHRLSQGQHKREARLTLRENQILQSIQNGLSNKEIAEQLCITPNTVKNHVHHLLEKLRVKSRHEAARTQLRGVPLLVKSAQTSLSQEVQPALFRGLR